MVKKWQEIKEKVQDADEFYLKNAVGITREELDWLIEQAEKVNEVKELINDERITKGETVDKISVLINEEE